MHRVDGTVVFGDRNMTARLTVSVEEDDGRVKTVVVL